MKVYDIDDGFCYSQIHSVVAENMAQAERIYKTKYPYNIIRNITLHSEYVQVQGIDNAEAAAELDRLEAQLNFSNATITELRGQLEKMAVERDSLKQQLAAANAEIARLNAELAPFGRPAPFILR